ncbi:MAG: acetylornithine deacetylase/succinyl-diaminopimelate desuccinylase-like protein [Myxococcota bacterium]|jgi:acetylornithine deacetylase/succinyl-diaminopimelate desuccinylase-like protein
MSLDSDIRRSVIEVLSARATATSRGLIVYLMDLLDHADFRIVEQASSFSNSSGTNLVGLRGPPGSGGLLLCSSIVEREPRHPELWQVTEEDPYNPTELDGLLYGYGTTGGKVDLVCRILAASRVDVAELKKPLIVAGLFGDEARIGGAMHLLDSGICSPQWALVGEATNLELVTAHRGYLLLEVASDLQPSPAAPSAKSRCFRVETQGLSAHSAASTLGRNAIECALAQIGSWRLLGVPFTVHSLTGGGRPGVVPERCSFVVQTEADWWPTGPNLVVETTERADYGPPLDAALEQWRDFRSRLHELFRWTAPEAPDFSPSSPIHAVIGVHATGSEITWWLDYRTLPGQRMEQLVRDVEILARRQSRIDRRLRVEVSRNLLPMETDRDAELVDACRSVLREIGVPAVCAAYPGYAEGWIFAAAQIQTVCFGPGDALSVAHRPDEFVPLDHIERASAFYERLIRRLCT